MAFMAPQKIKATIRYATLDEAEVWQMLLKADANAADWGICYSDKSIVSWMQRHGLVLSCRHPVLGTGPHG